MTSRRQTLSERVRQAQTEMLNWDLQFRSTMQLQGAPQSCRPHQEEDGQRESRIPSVLSETNNKHVR